MEMDRIDEIAASVLDGYLVRKDLVRTFSRQFPVSVLKARIAMNKSTARSPFSIGLGSARSSRR